MSFIREKQTRKYIYFLITVSIAIFIFAIFCNINYRNLAGKMVVSHDEALVSALIEQGVSVDIIAKAFKSPTATKEGMKCILSLGMTKDNALWYTPNCSQSMNAAQVTCTSISILLIGFLLGGTYFYFIRREQLYQEASKTVHKFAEGDFTNHMSRNQEGTLFHLYSAIDELAMSLKSKEETEHQTKEFLKDSISNISHQLKTPLAALHMYNEIIEGEPENTEMVKQFALKSETALKRIDRLIQLLLKMMRLDAGSITFTKERYKVKEIIMESVEDLWMRAKAEHKILIIEGNEETLIDCDMLWTCEAIGNLAKNALDHTNENGKVNITWNETPAMLRIMVTDDGNGILPEDIYHIFKRFYRGSKENDTPGVGLGLPLAKAIVEGQEGTLTVESVIGEGATFTICLKRPFLTES